MPYKKNSYVRRLKIILKRYLGVIYLCFGLVFLNSLILKLIFPDRKKLLIFMYHGIEEKKLNFDDNISMINFKQQIYHLSHKFKIVSLHEAINYLKTDNCKTKKELAVLTFDDAYVGVYENAYPLLNRMNIPATIFVPVNYVGKAGEWTRDEAGFNGEIMTWDMILELAKDPRITIGSHGMNHEKLSKLTEIQIKKELTDSKATLENKIGHEVRYFCYPWGQATECTSLIVRKLIEIRYHAACSTIWGRFSSVRNIYALRRIGINYQDSMFDFELKINGAYDWLEILHLLKGFVLSRSARKEKRKK